MGGGWGAPEAAGVAHVALCTGAGQVWPGCRRWPQSAGAGARRAGVAELGLEPIEIAPWLAPPAPDWAPAAAAGGWRTAAGITTP